MLDVRARKICSEIGSHNSRSESTKVVAKPHRACYEKVGVRKFSRCIYEFSYVKVRVEMNFQQILETVFRSMPIVGHELQLIVRESRLLKEFKTEIASIFFMKRLGYEVDRSLRLSCLSRT